MRKGTAPCLSAPAHFESGNTQANPTPMASSDSKSGGAILEDGRHSSRAWQMLKREAGFATRRVSMQTSTAESERESGGARLRGQVLPGSPVETVGVILSPTRFAKTVKFASRRFHKGRVVFCRPKDDRSTGRARPQSGKSIVCSSLRN